MGKWRTRDILTYTRQMLRGRRLQRPPVWFDGVSKHPPVYDPPRNPGPIPTVRLPTDELFDQYYQRLRLRKGERPSLEQRQRAAKVVQKQYQLMSKRGVDRREAFAVADKTVRDAEERERRSRLSKREAVTLMAEAREMALRSGAVPLVRNKWSAGAAAGAAATAAAARASSSEAAEAAVGVEAPAATAAAEQLDEITDALQLAVLEEAALKVQRARARSAYDDAVLAKKARQAEALQASAKQEGGSAASASSAGPGSVDAPEFKPRAEEKSLEALDEYFDFLGDNFRLLMDPNVQDSEILPEDAGARAKREAEYRQRKKGAARS